MGKVTSTVVDPMGQPAAEGGSSVVADASAAPTSAKPALQHLVEAKISKELRQLQARYHAYKRDGESGDLPKISSEVLMDMATTSAAQEEYQGRPRMAPPKTSKASKAQPPDEGRAILNSYKSVKSCQRNGEIFQIHVEAKMRTGSIDVDDFWQETNLSKNADGRSIESLMAERLLHLANEDVKLGYKMPECHLELLKRFNRSADGSASGSAAGSQSSSSSFEKYFHISEQSQQETNAFKKVCVKQIYTLYSIYLQRQKLSEEDKKEFFDYIASFLNIPKDDAVAAKPTRDRRRQGVQEARTQIGLDTGLKFSMNLLRELGKTNPPMLTSSLRSLLDSLTEYRPGALYSATDRMGYQLDENLNQARELLVEIVGEVVANAKALTSEQKDLVTASIQLIFTLGIIRSNVEDYLTVLAILSELLQAGDTFAFVDLSDQIRLLQKYYGYDHADELGIKNDLEKKKEVADGQKENAAQQSFQIGQQNLLTTIAIKMSLHSGDLIHVKGSLHDKMVADEEHFYFYKNQHDKGMQPGLYKVTQAAQMQSSRGAAFRMAGKNLKQNTSQIFAARGAQGLDSQMFILDGKIYMKYEAPAKPSQDDSDTKKAGASAARAEADQKAAAPDSEQTLSCTLMVIDANTLEPLRTVKRVPKPAERDAKKEQKESSQASPARGSTKAAKAEAKDAEPETMLVAEPVTVSLEHIVTWKSQTKQYRNQELCHDRMPMITDGEHLYVFGRNKLKRADGKPEKPSIVVNIYKIEKAASSDGPHNLPRFTYLRQITLIWKESEPFEKDDNSERFVGQIAQWATNGQVLLCFTRPSRVHWFDLQTGRFLDEQPISGDHRDHTLIYYNYNSSQFIKMQTKDHNSDCHEYWIFNFANLKVQDREVRSTDQLNALRRQLYRQADSESQKFGYQNPNLIKTLMKRPKKAAATSQKAKPAREALPLNMQRGLILDFINQFTLEKFALFYEEVRNKSQSNQSAEDILGLFKYQNCTYLTENSFILLADNLFSLRPLISGQGKLSISEHPDSIAQQYSLLYLLNLVSANFKALSHCQIKLSFLLDNELEGLSQEKQKEAKEQLSAGSLGFWEGPGSSLQKGYNYFMAAYEATIVAVVEKAGQQAKLAAIPDVKVREELTQLWQQIASVCKEIIDESVNLLHQDPSSMIEILLGALSKPKEEISYQNVCVQVSYLNLKDNLRKVIDCPEIHVLSTKIFELFGDQILKAYAKPLSATTDKNEKLVELTTRDFILNYTQLILQKYCETQEGLTKMHKKLHSAEALLEASAQVVDGDAQSPCVVNKYEKPLMDTIELAFKYVEEHLSQILTLTSQKEEAPQDLLAAQLDKVTQVNALADILKNRDVFYETAFVYAQMLALLKLDSFEGNQVMVRLIKRFMAIIKLCAAFQSVEIATGSPGTDSHEMQLAARAPELLVAVDNLYRLLAWLLGQTAHRMISVQKEKEEGSGSGDSAGPSASGPKMTDQQKKNLAIIQESSLLSGGVEPRYLAEVLSKDRQKLLKTYLGIIEDQYLQEQFDATKKESAAEDSIDDDRILKAIINEGVDPSTDCLLKCIQRSLEMKIPMVPYARLAGENGLRMSRAAFALLIKFGDMLEDFVSLVDQVQFFKEIKEVEGTQTTDLNSLIKILKDLPQFASIRNKWEQASKMRKWISDMKSKLAGKYETELRHEVLKKKKEAATKAAEAKKEAAKEADQIDSSSQPTAQTQAQEGAEKEKEKDKKQLTSEEEAYVADEGFNRAEKELEGIFAMIKQKSEFLIKLQIPLQFINKKTLMNELSPPSEGSESVKPKSAEDESAPVGNSAEKQAPEAQSCVSCVLSLLQTPVDCAKIQEQVELIYLNACKRVTGLHIIADLVKLEAPQYITKDTLNWFCAALRGGKNKITHYMDDIRGEGTYLENKTRMYFFQVLTQIVKRLKEADSVQDIKFYLMNALLWRFMGRDHKDLLELGIFQVLHKGNGKKGNLIKRSWGKYLYPAQIDEQSLSSDVIGYFENLLISILARIVDPSPYESEQSAKKKKNQLSLQKAKSVINEDVSETLLAQGYDVIFKELDRYVKVMNYMFRGIDWATYAKARTSREDLRHVVNLKIQEIDLFDEESDEEEDANDQDRGTEVKKEEPSEENLKKAAEEKQKQRTARQLAQIDKLYQEKFLKKLLGLVEMFTSVQSSLASQKQSAHKFSGLLAKLSSSTYVATLLNLLVLASPAVKFIVLRILQQLIRIQHISHKIFDQAVQRMLEEDAPQQEDQAAARQTEAKLIYNQLSEYSKITKGLQSPFLRFLYAYLHSIRSKMWSKMTLESEGAYAVSCEILRTLRLIHEESGSLNQKWRVELEDLMRSVFMNFGTIKHHSPVDLELVMGLVRGCEFLSMTPYAAGFVNEKRSAEEPLESGDKDSASAPRKKYVQVVGFVQRKWLSRSAESSESEQRVRNTMKDSGQKVLVVQYDSKDLSDAQYQLHSPQNLTLISDLNGLRRELTSAATAKQAEMEQPSSQAAGNDGASAEQTSPEFKITSEILDAIWRESNILEAATNAQATANSGPKKQSESSQLDIHALSQRTAIMKLIHHNLETIPKDFLKVLKSSSLYRQLLRFVCQQSASQESDDASGNQITLIDWLEQRCAAIRQHACENQTSLMKYKEVKVQLVQGKLYVQTQGGSLSGSSSGSDKNEFNMTAIQLLSAINYRGCEEKREFKLVLESDVNVSDAGQELSEQNQLAAKGKNKMRDLLDSEEAVEETDDIVAVQPENLKSLNAKGLEILNQSKAIITYDVEFADLVGLLLEKQQVNKERYARLSTKTVFLVEKEEFQAILDILGDKGQSHGTAPAVEKMEADQMYEKMLGATPFEESLIEALIRNGGFSRVVAEKIVSKEGTLEEKTLHFSKIVKQIKDGVIDVKELEEFRDSEIQGLVQDNSTMKKKKRLRKSQIEQKHFDRPEEKCEVLQSLKKNFINFVYRSEGDASVEDFNDRHAYFEKVNSFSENEGLYFEYEKILKRLFAMYCRQIFWSLIQNDEIETIFEQILIQQEPDAGPKDAAQIDSSANQGQESTGDSQILDSMRAFSNFIKVIGNECFITNNKRYISNFKAFLKKVVQTCCQKDGTGPASKYKSLLRIMLEESIIECYREHFGEITGDYSDFKKPIFEYFQSESRAQLLLNPIVLTEITHLIIEYDKQLIFEHVVDLVSLLASVSMYFVGSYELKGKFIEQLLRIVELVRSEYLRQRDAKTVESGVKITKETVEQLISLKIFQAYYAEFENYHQYNMEEVAHAKRGLLEDSNRELNGVPRKHYERQVYVHRPAVHQKYIDVEQNRADTNKLLIELAYKLRQLSELPEMDVYFCFQNNLMSYIDLYKRVLALLTQGDGSQAAQHVKCSDLNKYLTFYHSLEEEQKVYSQNVELRLPDEGSQVQTLEVDFSGGDEAAKQLVEKVLVRIDGDSQFQSHGAAVLVSQDRDGKHLVALYNKTLFKKDQTLQSVFSKGKNFYIHYPVYPDYNYVMSITSEEPKFDLMERQLFQQFDDFANHDLGTFYLGGNRTKLHSLHSEQLKPYKDHLDIQMITFGKHSMILLLKSGQVYGLGRNKYRHFVDQEQSRNHEREQLIPFFDSKDKVESIESYKRVTVAVTRKGKIYAVGDKLKKILKIKDERFGFFALPLTEEEALAAAEAGREPSGPKEGEGDGTVENQDVDKKEKGAKAACKLKAKKAWISRCKASGNFVIYSLMENTETQELEIYSIGKNSGGCLLGLGADEQEALHFKKLTFKDPADPEGKKELKIASVEGVDIRCGQHHTIFGLNGNEQVYVIGCYNRSSQAQEEIISVPTQLGLCAQYKVQKFDTEKNKTVIVAEKKDSGTVQVLVGQFAPLVKEESFKTAQLELDLSGKTTPTRVSQIYVRDGSAYVSTTGSFRIDPYDQLSTTVKTGFAAQGLKQSIQVMPQKQPNGARGSGKSSGITMTLTPDYGFFENKDFIKHRQVEWDKFQQALDEYKTVLRDVPDDIPDFEKRLDAFCDSWLKDGSFQELMTYWKNIRAAGDLDTTRLKLKDNEQNNEQISFECKKLNIGLYSTYTSYIWGSLSYISRSVASPDVARSMPLLSTFLAHRRHIPWPVMNKMLKQHLGSLRTDGDSLAIHIVRKKAQDFAQSGQVDLKGEHTIFAQVQKRLEAARYLGLRINNSDKKAWFVKYIGEAAVDDGGLFRDCLSEMCSELRHQVQTKPSVLCLLPLLVPTKNQQGNVGQDREMHVLNPGASTDVQLKMMQFLGALMGMSFRSGILLDLNISRLTWKQIVGDEVTKEDLKFVDEQCVKQLDEILEKSKKLSDEEFAEQFTDYTMSTQLSNDEVVDLVENGRTIPLTRDKAALFCEKALAARLEESKVQVGALVDGIKETFDRNFLRIISWQYLEYRVMGLNEISLERLKEISAYRNCTAEHEVVRRFWQVLESFSNEERIGYLKFVWGRTRLPLKEEEHVENHMIELIESWDTSWLPVGRTCFFKLQLPPYESVQQLKTKLHYSITHCRSIDADYDRAGTSNEEDQLSAGQAEAAAHESEDSDVGRPPRYRMPGADHDYSSGGDQDSGGHEEGEEDALGRGGGGEEEE